MRWPLAIGSVVFACAFGLLAIACSVAEAGGGHGTYYLAKLFFPYTMSLAPLAGSITPPLIVLALVQFPAYGILLAIAEWKKRYRQVAVGIALVHLLAVLLCFPIRMP